MDDTTVEATDAAWLESLAPQLLRDEYPDQMAARSCTCEPEATCGAHRLLARYDALYQHMAGLNAERRDLRRRLREAPVDDTTVEALGDPRVWDRIAEAIGKHPYEYDMGDDSHRLDVVQIVCEAILRSRVTRG